MAHPRHGASMQVLQLPKEHHGRGAPSALGALFPFRVAVYYVVGLCELCRTDLASILRGMRLQPAPLRSDSESCAQSHMSIPWNEMDLVFTIGTTVLPLLVQQVTS